MGLRPVCVPAIPKHLEHLLHHGHTSGLEAAQRPPVRPGAATAGRTNAASLPPPSRLQNVNPGPGQQMVHTVLLGCPHRVRGLQA